MYALSSKSGSETFSFALFLGDLRWNDSVMTIEYLKCRVDLKLEVDFGVNSAIRMIVTKCDLILF